MYTFEKGHGIYSLQRRIKQLTFTMDQLSVIEVLLLMSLGKVELEDVTFPEKENEVLDSISVIVSSVDPLKSPWSSLDPLTVINSPIKRAEEIDPFELIESLEKLIKKHTTLLNGVLSKEDNLKNFFNFVTEEFVPVVPGEDIKTFILEIANDLSNQGLLGD